MEHFETLKEIDTKTDALSNLATKMRNKDLRMPIPFNDFLQITANNPSLVFRDIFQLFYDMVHHYVADNQISNTNNGSIVDNFNMNKLFVKDCDNPFFTDRLFANRFLKLTNGFKKGIQNNNIFLFEGPPGSGKSTFLNNLLQKFEDYTKLPQGTTYQTHWKLDVNKLGGFKQFEKQLAKMIDDAQDPELEESYLQQKNQGELISQEFLQFACPNHDHPILHIPKNYRKNFLGELIHDEDIKQRLFTEKEYEWVLKDIPCSICASLYATLLNELGDPLEVFNMLHVRKTLFNRQYGEGISVFNPGDPLFEHSIRSPTIQMQINDLLKNDEVAYVYSKLAKTNNGIYALMDIKEHNIKRLMQLHGIISDGVHKVELIEERIKSLFVGLVNPADKLHYESMPSFRDRIISLNVPYILDYNIEVGIYKNKFGKDIEKYFLPGVLENVAKTIVASRLNRESPSIENWIRNPIKYRKYLDKNCLLLKMEIYAGKTPNWLTEEDLKRFDRKTRKDILTESETEGNKGFSGRQSLNVFNSFLTKYYKKEKLITMDNVNSYFGKKNKLDEEIPEGFVESLKDMYDFNVLQDMKEAIYSYNREQIARSIQNYLYCINFEEGETVTSQHTGDTLEVTDDFFLSLEVIFLGKGCSWNERLSFREDQQAKYVSTTLSQELLLENKKITETQQFQSLFDKYINNLKENVLEPYLNNDNFRRAILDFGTNSFNAYDKRLKQDVTLLLKNLQEKFKYTEEGARQVCIYALDKNLAEKYHTT